MNNISGNGKGGSRSAISQLRQDGDDMCMICWTETLHEAPCIQLKCGHVVHLTCCRRYSSSIRFRC